mmetsp:Transcript_25585/g.54363  ORF Transcript_25585/g.54363 Transcript_25585/m.54363 type:complete len:93 (+) Transcript_25585:1091-1369(+)
MTTTGSFFNRLVRCSNLVLYVVAMILILREARGESRGLRLMDVLNETSKKMRAMWRSESNTRVFEAMHHFLSAPLWTSMQENETVWSYWYAS